MGYHVITTNKQTNKIEQTYIKNLTELIWLSNITEDSLILQGEKQSMLIRVGDKKEYSNYTKDWFRAGLKAQEKFKEQAKSEGLILEEINQDKDSFSQYSVVKPVKRGDFLIRNRNNIEVEVKCRSFRKINDKLVFHFKCIDVERHLNMQNQTNIPVLIAVYKRNGEDVEDGIPYFISIDEIISNKTSLDTVNEAKENTGICYRIPLSMTSQSFNYIEEINGQKAKNKSYSIEEMQTIDVNAYKKWTSDDDKQLKKLYCKQISIKELSETFGRNQGAIKSRIKKLKL